MQPLHEARRREAAGGLSNTVPIWKLPTCGVFVWAPRDAAALLVARRAEDSARRVVLTSRLSVAGAPSSEPSEDLSWPPIEIEPVHWGGGSKRSRDALPKLSINISQGVNGRNESLVRSHNWLQAAPKYFPTEVSGDRVDGRLYNWRPAFQRDGLAGEHIQNVDSEPPVQNWVVTAIGPVS